VSLHGADSRRASRLAQEDPGEDPLIETIANSVEPITAA